MMQRFVIVGAGQAAFSLSSKLRDLGFDGKINLLGEEEYFPYQRPPLSKAYLLGKIERQQLELRPSSYYVAKDIKVCTGSRVVSVDSQRKAVILENGRNVEYDKLALTTGARARTLSVEAGGMLDGVFALRTIDDIDKMKVSLAPGKHILILGGGYIGLEAASAVASRGLKVTIVEAAERILQRVASEHTSNYFSELHRSHGVEILTGAKFSKFEGVAGKLARAIFSDGRHIDVDLAIVGIGATPNTELAKGAGLLVDNEVAVDSVGRTSNPHIFAAGDCASFPLQGVRTRLESVQNAIEQSETVAQAMMGFTSNYSPVPWFWSDQYDAKLQIVGLSRGSHDVVLREGTREGSKSVWYFSKDKLVAVDALNDPRSYMVAKRLLEKGRSISKAQLNVPDLNLNSLLEPS